MGEGRKSGVLAIETSTDLLGVALSDQGKVLYEMTLLKPRVHSKALLPACLEALQQVGMKPRDLSCIAVTVGPGSFTGLRIGCSCAQGLALAWGKKVVAVNTFLVLLEQCRPYPSVAIVMGKVRSQMVTGFYVRGKTVAEKGWEGSGFREVIPQGKGNLEELVEAARLAPPTVAVGDGARLLGDMAGGLQIGGPYETLPRPGTVAVLGGLMAQEGLAVPPQLAVPQYFRRSQAEVKFAGRQTEGEHTERSS